MKIEVQMISDQNVRAIQLVNTLVVFLIIGIAILMGVLNGEIIDALEVVLIGVIFWGPVFVLYNKLFEVKLSGDKVIVRNLFNRFELLRSEFVEISPALLPLVYKIYFRDFKSYYFIIPISNIFGILFTNRDEIVEKMKAQIRN